MGVSEMKEAVDNVDYVDEKVNVIFGHARKYRKSAVFRALLRCKKYVEIRQKKSKKIHNLFFYSMLIRLWIMWITIIRAKILQQLRYLRPP